MAVLLLATAHALRAALAVPPSPRRRAAREQYAEQLKAMLGREAFARAWAAGESMPPAQAAEAVLDGMPRE